MCFESQMVNSVSALATSLPYLDCVDLNNKKIFLRADFNTPVDEYGNIIDDGRLRAAIPTVNYLLDRGAKIILASHRSGNGKNCSLAPLTRRLSRIWGVDIKFSPEVIGETTFNMVNELKAGEVLLLENLRSHPGEMAADEDFAKALASMADVYVNDAFGVCHRNHASLTTITKYFEVCVAGFQVKNELSVLKRVLDAPVRPLAAIIGGREFDAKIPAIDYFLDNADYLLLAGSIGDALALEVHKRTASWLNLEEKTRDKIKNLAKKLTEGNFKAKVFLPVDIIATDINSGENILNIPYQLLEVGYRAADIGPATLLLYQEVLSRCKTIIWSGPAGAFEDKAFSRGTTCIAKILSESNAVTLAGGVKTTTALLKMGELNKLSFISTGGSAFLKLVSGRPLVALEALKKNFICDKRGSL